jgi:hypothetical protein
MPWSSDDAKRFTKKADTQHKREVWARTANRVLKNTGDESRAIREANAVVAGMGGKGKKSEK